MDEIRPSPGLGYRRKAKKHLGKEWSPNTRNGPNVAIGPWCSHCHSIHPWKSQKQLGVAYEKRNTVWYIMWVCQKTGNVIKEQGL